MTVEKLINLLSSYYPWMEVAIQDPGGELIYPEELEEGTCPDGLCVIIKTE